MRDTVTVGTIAGAAGAVVLDVFVYLLLVLGVKTSTPWDVAADIFLVPAQINTLAGLFIGLVGTLALGIGSAVIIALIIRSAGPANAWLKGILVGNAVGFGTMALMPPLGIARHVQNEPVTNVVALAALSLFGIAASFIILKLGAFTADKTRQ